MKKSLSWWGQTSQQSLDSALLSLLALIKQKIRIHFVTCLAHHPAVYMNIPPSNICPTGGESEAVSSESTTGVG